MSQEQPDVAVTYKSLDENVATVDADGKVTALCAGIVTITAALEESEEYKKPLQVMILPLKKRIRPVLYLQIRIRGNRAGEPKVLRMLQVAEREPARYIMLLQKEMSVAA